jgi:hypothetical protein
MSTLKSGTGTRLALDTLTSQLGATAVVEVYNDAGPIPGTTDDGDLPNVVIATFPMSAVAFNGATVDGAQATAVANQIFDEPSIPAPGGKATYFRIRVTAVSGAVEFQGPITITNGGGDLTFDSIDFITGGLATIDSFSLQLQR